MKRISIIIPAYNASRTIERCLGSIMPQSKDCEVIVIDDGSSDNTYELCSNVSDNYSNFSILKQNRGGVSAARNLGIEKASGEYIMFVDADDVVEKDSLPQIIKYLDNTDFNPDFVMFGMRSVTMGGDTFIIKEFEYSEIDDVKKFYRELNYNSLAYGAPWGRLFRRKTILDNSVRFDMKFKRHQDVVFNTHFAPYCKRILTLPVVGYNYIHSVHGATMKFFGDELIFLNNGVRQSLIDYFVEFCGEKEAMKRINRRSALDYLYSIYNVYRRKGVKRKYYWTKRYWEAAEKNDPAFSHEFNSGIPKIAGMLGRTSKLSLHMFLYTIFTAEKIKLALKKE